MHSQYFEKPISKRFIDAFPKFKDELGEGKNYFYETWQKSPFYLEIQKNLDNLNGYIKFIALNQCNAFNKTYT